jgi:predicted TIM-barrel fold metal-dependent hydrolase
MPCARELSTADRLGAPEPEGTPMTEPVRRVVDAHVHHWDPTRTDRYPYLATDDALRELGMHDVSAMRRVFDQPTYLREAAKWNVEKYVHVGAAVPPHHLEETDELEELARQTGRPDAIIGEADPDAGVPTIVAALDRQCAGDRFRGVRAGAGMDGSSATGRAVLAALQERELVYDLVVHPDGMAAEADALARFPSLTVVVEHTGWPLALDAAHAQQWRDGMARLADLGERVHCKLSGLVMTVNEMSVAALRPWIEGAIEIFGVDRCFFASNFPVDGLFGTFDQLYGVYDEITAHLAPGERDRLFATNAERVYRC